GKGLPPRVREQPVSPPAATIAAGRRAGRGAGSTPRRTPPAILLRRQRLVRCQLGHRFLHDLQEVEALIPGEQVRELLVRGDPLIVVEDRDLFHAAVEDAPAGAAPRRRLLRPHFPYLALTR